LTSVSKNYVKWVVSNGQWVYWKGYRSVTVHENNEEGKVHDMLTGQVNLQSGVELYKWDNEVEAEEGAF